MTGMDVNSGAAGSLGGRNYQAPTVSAGGGSSTMASLHNAAMQGAMHGAQALSAGLQESDAGNRPTVGSRDAEGAGSAAFKHNSMSSMGRREGGSKALAALTGGAAAMSAPTEGTGCHTSEGFTTVPPVGGSMPMQIMALHTPTAGNMSEGYTVSPAGTLLLHPPASSVAAVPGLGTNMVSMPMLSSDLNGRRMFQNPIYTQANSGLLPEMGVPTQPTYQSVASGEEADERCGSRLPGFISTGQSPAMADMAKAADVYLLCH